MGGGNMRDFDFEDEQAEDNRKRAERTVAANREHEEAANRKPRAQTFKAGLVITGRLVSTEQHTDGTATIELEGARGQQVTVRALPHGATPTAPFALHSGPEAVAILRDLVATWDMAAPDYGRVPRRVLNDARELLARLGAL